MEPVLHKALPPDQIGDPRLPGTRPCPPHDWLRVDEAYAAQMAQRIKLLREDRADVLHEPANIRDMGREVLDEALAILPNLGFEISGDHALCPDGRSVPLDRDAPLWTLGHLVQEDICILQKQDTEHVLAGAVLCFPANWRLAEKLNRPLIAIHAPVEDYDDTLARRVQRLFDGVQVGKPLWRFNRLRYADAELHQPYRKTENGPMPYIRSERQCIVRLPKTRGVVFSIHTYVVEAAPPA